MEISKNCCKRLLFHSPNSCRIKPSTTCLSKSLCICPLSCSENQLWAKIQELWFMTLKDSWRVRKAPTTSTYLVSTTLRQNLSKAILDWNYLENYHLYRSQKFKTLMKKIKFQLTAGNRKIRRFRIELRRFLTPEPTSPPPVETSSTTKSYSKKPTTRNSISCKNSGVTSKGKKDFRWRHQMPVFWKVAPEGAELRAGHNLMCPNVQHLITNWETFMMVSRFLDSRKSVSSWLLNSWWPPRHQLSRTENSTKPSINTHQAL